MNKWTNIRRGASYVLVELPVEVNFYNSTAVKEEIKSNLLPEDRVVVLDLSRTSIIDSSGVGVMISLIKALNGGRLVVIAPDPRVRRVLEITRVDKIVELVGSRAEAEDRLT